MADLPRYRPSGPWAVPDLPADFRQGEADADAGRSRPVELEPDRPTSPERDRFDQAHGRWRSRRDVAIVHGLWCDCGEDADE